MAGMGEAELFGREFVTQMLFASCLLIKKKIEDRSDVVQSDFEEDSDDVTKKMKTNHVFKSLPVDTW